MIYTPSREGICQPAPGSDTVMREHTANPTRVAMDELQLHDLKNMDATYQKFNMDAPLAMCYSPAVEVKQNAMPAMDDVTTVPRMPVKGSDSRIPILKQRSTKSQTV